MYYQTRENGRYYMIPVSPERYHERTELSETEFFERWRCWASVMGDDVEQIEQKIAEVRGHNRDIAIF